MNVNNTKVFGYYVAVDEKVDSRKDFKLYDNGCDEIIVEKLSASKKGREALASLIEHMRKGDTLMVCHINELGKTKNQLIDFLFDLKAQAVQFKSLDNRFFDTTEEGGELGEIIVQLKIMDSDIKSGLIKSSMRARGRKGGRPSGSYDKKKAAAVVQKYQLGVPVSQICEEHKISKSTMYRYLKYEGVK